MAQVVYVFTRDCGDGTSTVGYTLNGDYLDENQNDDDLMMNEGFSDVLEFPDDLDLHACGICLTE